MPRRAKYAKRVTPPDYRYGSSQLKLFINKVMLSGKKAAAERIVYGALDLAATRLSRTPMDLF